MNMGEKNEKTAWHDRLAAEHAELKERLAELMNFISSEEYYKLSENHRTVLQNQKVAMELYLQTLSIRLYEDLDKNIVPNFGALSIIASMFNSPWGGNTPVDKNPLPGSQVPGTGKQEADTEQPLGINVPVGGM